MRLRTVRHGLLSDFLTSSSAEPLTGECAMFRLAPQWWRRFSRLASAAEAEIVIVPMVSEVCLVWLPESTLGTSAGAVFRRKGLPWRGRKATGRPMGRSPRCRTV